jgi:hypothetical protein
MGSNPLASIYATIIKYNECIVPNFMAKANFYCLAVHNTYQSVGIRTYARALDLFPHSLSNLLCAGVPERTPSHITSVLLHAKREPAFGGVHPLSVKRSNSIYC